MEKYDQNLEYSNNNLSNFDLDEENNKDALDSLSFHFILSQIACKKKKALKKKLNSTSKLATTYNKNNYSNDKV